MHDPAVFRSLHFERFHAEPAVFAAPGRVNLIGEHTDYNDGYVLPVAIDRWTFVASKARADRIVRVAATDLDDEDQFLVDSISHSTEHPWCNYVRGVAAALIETAGELGGADLLIRSNLPREAGLSSSAALEVAVARTFCMLNRLALSGREIALVAQRAENDFVGLRCGIMDQFTVTMGRPGGALLLDCRDLTVRHIPLPAGINVVVCDSHIERRLAASGYNERRKECEQAVGRLRQWYPPARALRDIGVEQLREHEHELPAPVRARARHVVTENERTLRGAAALERGDAAGFGELMNESHRSLRDDFEVCPPEIDLLAELARRVPGCYGSRLTGGGFGGCTVSLVAEAEVSRFNRDVAERYYAATGREATVYVCRASEGARVAWPATREDSL
jgi:galactokinase